MNKKWDINILTDEAMMEWAKRPCWALGEAHWLMAGLAPEAVRTTDHIPDIGAYGKEAEALVHAVEAKLLVQLGTDKYGVAVFKPADIVRVAKDANIGMWQAWESVFTAMESTAQPPPTCYQKRPPLQHPWQEREILRVIRELGYEPDALPKAPAGTAGVKRDIRQRLTGSAWQGTVFDKAWQRLRDDGQIAEQ